MGVRFPSNEQRADFPLIQQAEQQTQAAIMEQRQGAGRPEAREIQTAEQTAAIQTAESERSEHTTQPERAAANAGVQTPGAIIDLLA